MNSIVIITSFIVFKQFEPALYGIISLVISSNAISRLRHKGIDVAKHLISNSPRGVTIIDAVGGYTMTNKNVLVCALKENEAVKFQERILDIDKSAFIIFSESSQIVGNGFRVYK